jgi:hypothetical protein
MQHPWHRHDPLESAIYNAAKEITQAIDRLTSAVKAIQQPNNAATGNRLIVSVGGSSLNPTITVDTTNATVTLEFQDDKGDATTAPSGASVVFSSDTPSVCTVAADATNPFQGDLSPVAIGSFNLSAVVSGSYANQTAIAPPAPLALTIQAGAAAGDALVVAASN